MTPIRLFRAVALATAVLSPSALLAQDASSLSADDLKERFENQKTRGLVIAPSTGGSAQASGAQGTTASVVEPATSDQGYVPLDQSEQVFVSISFDFDSAALRDDQKVKLVTLCEAMKEVDVDLFRIVGHTDASGTASYNERLSLLRAQEVKRHLVSDCGIAPDRLEAIGVGESFPLNADDPRGDANRRVEFQALS